ncbi:hypothetical protein [Anaerospora hongkongensis]|uniref:hypothetical protein n=1 Tax=Anaerospora hongkongensis TaxID=244830 RepID=UPI00289D8BC4|nr:hypothetical protein [Anaerospora hongkongensis]
MNPFNSSILKVLNKVSCEMFVVQQEFKIDCSCVNFTTKQAVICCPKCLGTGKKIRIKKIKGVSQNSKVSIRLQSVGEKATTRVYYVKGNTPIYQDNIFVNGMEVDVVQRLEKIRGDHQVPLYYKCVTTPKKVSIQTFLQNFNKIIGRG